MVGLIATIAVVEAGLGLLARWLSASIGEGLILDLRTAVFDPPASLGPESQPAIATGDYRRTIHLHFGT